MERVVDLSLSTRRFYLVLLLCFAVLALTLASAGLYHEMGIRMALGARPGELLKLILGQGMT
jgi:hypothetical protein